MVNQVWEAFEEWVNAIVEVVPPFERDAHTEVKNAKEKLELAIEEKKQVDATTNIEIRDKSGVNILDPEGATCNGGYRAKQTLFFYLLLK
jgi:hypothetical protein